MKNSQRPTSSGFTLIELLVVIGILAVIAAFVGPNLIGKSDEANIKATGIQIQKISAAVDLYRLETGAYPGQLQDLITPPSDTPRWKGPYLKGKKLPPDPWGNTYRYRHPGEHGVYDLYSVGSDGREGGEGNAADIGNW